MKKGNLYQIFKYLLLFTTAALLLWFSFREVKWEDFSVGLKSTDYRWVLLSMLISIAAFWIRGLRWRMIMMPLGVKIKRRDTWNGVNIGYITNFAVPRAGELARCGVITKRTGLSFEKVAGTVVLERAVDLLSILITFLIIVVFRWDRFGNFFSKHIFSAMGERFSNGIAIVLFAILFTFILFFYIVYTYRKRHRFFGKISEIVKGILTGLVSGFRMPQKWLFLLYTVLISFCYWLMSYTAILAFPALSQLNGTDALFLMVAGGFGWVVPVQGGIGAYHIIVSIALATIYGIDQTTGVVFATISHGAQSITMLLCGTLSFISFSLSKRALP